MTDEWNAPVIPHGGMVTAIAARAMAHHLGIAEQPVRSVSVVFAGQVLAGDLNVQVTMIRKGRSISQLMATVTNDGSEAGLTAIAVFGASRPGFSFTDLTMPTAPHPDLCGTFDDPPPSGIEIERKFNMGFWDNAIGKPAVGTPFWDTETPRTTTERATWYRFKQAPRLEDGSWDPLAIVTFCDTMPGAIGQRVGGFGQLPMWFSPSADLHVQMMGEARSEWLLAHNFCRKSADGYASLEMRMWDPGNFNPAESGQPGGPQLVAYATQQMFFSWPEGPPTEDQLTVR